MDNKSFHSFAELKKASHGFDLASGMDSLSNGNLEEAVHCFDSIKDFSALGASDKKKVKDAYYSYGKHLQHLWRLGEACSYFEKARNIDNNDIALLARIRLLQQQPSYRTAANIGKFRMMVKEGFTEGKYGNLQYPFLQIAKKHGLIQEPRSPITESDDIDSFLSIGVYQKQYEGKHLLSELIRRYKAWAHPELACPFAWLLADIIRSKTNLLEHIDMMVPLPSNPNKQVERGFTPCLLVAQELSTCLAVPYYELFMVAPMDFRFRQVSYAEGRELIRHKSGQTRNIPRGREVLLLDDVATTGRTLSLHADILKEIGAKRVYAITLAKTGKAKTIEG